MMSSCYANNWCAHTITLKNCTKETEYAIVMCGKLTGWVEVGVGVSQGGMLSPNTF